MTLYINPFSRQAARRMMERMMDKDWTGIENNVYFPVDVRAEKDDFIITAFLPGVKSEDLNIQVVNETVSIQGEIKPRGDNSEDYLLQECPVGKFVRTLTLPDPLNSAKAEASLENGVLTLRVPKAEEARPKMIKVVSK